MAGSIYLFPGARLSIVRGVLYQRGDNDLLIIVIASIDKEWLCFVCSFVVFGSVLVEKYNGRS